MKALTVKQPWADAIVHGTKRTENRTWKPSQPVGSRILIHAGAAYDPMGRFVIDDRDLLQSWPDARGAIVAVAEISDVHSAQSGCCAPWGQPGVYHWALSNVVALPEPVPCGGRQMLWTPSDDVLAGVRRQLA